MKTRENSSSVGSRFLQFAGSRVARRPAVGQIEGIVDKAKCTCDELIVVTTEDLKFTFKVFNHIFQCIFRYFGSSSL